MTSVRSDAGDKELARQILPWIPDQATLEFGMGRWSQPLFDLLGQSRWGLKLHTGSLSDWVLPLVQRGCVDIDRGLVATAVGGTRRFYDAIPELGIELAPAYITHDPQALRSLPRFRAVNSVLEVDLLGRANSEFGPKGRRGGLGGLPDYAGGAAANPDGLSIIALNAAGGGVSRIVTRLPDQHVSLDETKIEIVITEFGSADLRGREPRERVRAMLKIAAPQFRHALERDAHGLELL